VDLLSKQIRILINNMQTFYCSS